MYVPISTTEYTTDVISSLMFNAAVIDECSQALEIACWLALIQSPKAVLAGDHLQLPPTIMSENAARKGLAFTLMERVISKSEEEDNHQKQDQVVRMLKIQYRMHQSIMHWSSTTFYENQLLAHSSVQYRLLKDLESGKEIEFICLEV